MIDVKLLYPIGSIYMSIQDTNPSVFFGGTWERIAKGKTLVGVDENDTDFDYSSKTGGEKEHTLTISEIPSHAHEELAISNPNSGGPGIRGTYNGEEGSGMSRYSTNAQTSTTGGSLGHNNMPPYYTCYIFVRTA